MQSKKVLRIWAQVTTIIHIHISEHYERDFEGDDTIGDIKEMIGVESNIDPKYIRLFYHGEEEILFSNDVTLFDVFGEIENVGVDFTTDPAALRKVTKRVDCTILEVNNTKAKIRNDPINAEAIVDLKKVSAVR